MSPPSLSRGCGCISFRVVGSPSWFDGVLYGLAQEEGTVVFPPSSRSGAVS